MLTCASVSGSSWPFFQIILVNGVNDLFCRKLRILGIQNLVNGPNIIQVRLRVHVQAKIRTRDFRRTSWTPNQSRTMPPYMRMLSLISKMESFVHPGQNFKIIYFTADSVWITVCLSCGHTLGWMLVHIGSHKTRTIRMPSHRPVYLIGVHERIIGADTNDDVGLHYSGCFTISSYKIILIDFRCQYPGKI